MCIRILSLNNSSALHEYFIKNIISLNVIVIHTCNRSVLFGYQNYNLQNKMFFSEDTHLLKGIVLLCFHLFLFKKSIFISFVLSSIEKTRKDAPIFRDILCIFLMQRVSLTNCLLSHRYFILICFSIMQISKIKFIF